MSDSRGNSTHAQEVNQEQKTNHPEFNTNSATPSQSGDSKSEDLSGSGLRPSPVKDSSKNPSSTETTDNSGPGRSGDVEYSIPEVPPKEEDAFEINNTKMASQAVSVGTSSQTDHSSPVVPSEGGHPEENNNPENSSEITKTKIEDPDNPGPIVSPKEDSPENSNSTASSETSNSNILNNTNQSSLEIPQQEQIVSGNDSSTNSSEVTITELEDSNNTNLTSSLVGGSSEGENSTKNSETTSELKDNSPQEAPLKTYPTSNPATHCERKDQRRKNLCRFFGKDCVRYGPVEELANFWMICALYTSDQQQTELLYDLHGKFLSYAKLFGFQTQTIEVVFPGQDYKVTQPNREPYELQYKADWIFNMRENLVNVGSKHLPNDWQYISWIDAHIFWDENRYFFEDIIVELHRNNIIHMLGSVDFYNEYNQSKFHANGFGKLFQQTGNPNRDPMRQCGMAWATRRDIFEATKGSLDVCIGTKCDLYQNYAYFGQTFTDECRNPNYANSIRQWQDNAISVYARKIGFVPGNIIHFNHCMGDCKTSSYDLMTQALSRFNFDPNHDMSRDSEGRLQFKDNFGLAKELWTIYGGDPR